jgi:hypothetical protein
MIWVYGKSLLTLSEPLCESGRWEVHPRSDFNEDDTVS